MLITFSFCFNFIFRWESCEIREISFTQSVRNVFPEMTVPIIYDRTIGPQLRVYYNIRENPGETGKTYIYAI